MALDRYIAGWVMAAVGATTAVLVLSDQARPDVVSIAVLALGIGVADRIELELRFERVDASFSLVEAAVVVAVLLTPPSEAVLAALVGAGLAALSRWLDVRRALFNVSQVGVAAAVAAGIVATAPPLAPTIAGRSVVVAFVAMIVYSSISTAAILGVFRRLGQTTSLEAIRGQVAVTLGIAVGTTAVGILLAHVWVTEPALTAFLLAPAAAIHLAARGALRSAELLEHVRTERDRLTRVIDGASDGILLLDHTGTVELWNPAMEALTGLQQDLAVGRRIDEVVTDQMREADAPVRGRWLVDDAHEGEPRRELDARLRHVDGTVRAVRESHALVFDERGRCTGDVVVVRDVSRQEQLNRLRSDFVARVSHELRTPLTPIRGFASVLLRRGDALTPEQRREALERIVERADHLGVLVEDLLLVTRVDRGELHGLVEPRPTDLRLLLDSAVDEATRATGRTISLHVASDVGAALADPERVRQVIQALVGNACQYSPDDTPIEVELDQDGDDIRLRVLDHGPGIPRDQRERIFERFHRLEDPMTMRTGGVGLGLFLARQFAEAMHGTLQLEGLPPNRGGACFVLSLPAAEPPARVETLAQDPT